MSSCTLHSMVVRSMAASRIQDMLCYATQYHAIKPALMLMFDCQYPPLTRCKLLVHELCQLPSCCIATGRLAKQHGCTTPRTNMSQLCNQQQPNSRKRQQNPNTNINSNLVISQVWPKQVIIFEASMSTSATYRHVKHPEGELQQLCITLTEP